MVVGIAEAAEDGEVARNVLMMSGDVSSVEAVAEEATLLLKH